MDYKPIQLPRDLAGLGEMIYDAFQYPENPQWSIQADEKEDIYHTIASFRHLWPLVRIAQFLSPPMRDMFKGYVAVEDGKIAAVTIIQRSGTTSTWVVGVVGVLPQYRRLGVARNLLGLSLEMMKERGSERTWLGVINGNIPAQRLYESLGFRVFDAMTEYSLSKPVVSSIAPLPVGYSISRLPRSDWKTRLSFERRITPEEASLYQPVVTGRFRQGPVALALSPIVNAIQRKKEKAFVVRQKGDGEAVARCSYSASMRGKGVNSISVRIDPKHPKLASALVGLMLQRVVSQSPRLRVEIATPKWMPAVAEAAEGFGFKKRVEYLKMGLSW
jgi:GNAT superfamily N-acetyltransferase